MKVLLANPRGFCAGVDRAIDIVERAIELFGAPIYVRHEVVHNRFVVDRLRALGAVFVDELDAVPDGATVIFSAHGVPSRVVAEAERRGLKVFDATCPLVTKVHMEVGKYAREGLDVILIGHAGHPEVEGTMGEAPDAIVLVETPEDVEALELEEGQSLAYLTQTTLSLDDTADVVHALRDRVPDLVGPPSADICYATQNRQDAVKTICRDETLVLVVGLKTSSNANRLVEVAKTCGSDAYLIDDESDLEAAWLVGHETVGLTAGASSPDLLVNRVAERLAELGFDQREEVELTREDVYFRLPAELR